MGTVSLSLIVFPLIHAENHNADFTLFARNYEISDLLFAVDLPSTATIGALAHEIISFGSDTNGLPSFTLPQQLQFIFADGVITNHALLLSDVGILSESTISYSLRRDIQPVIVSLEMSGWQVSNIYLGMLQLPCYHLTFWLKQHIQDWLEKNNPEIMDINNDIILGFKHLNMPYNKSSLFDINLHGTPLGDDRYSNPRITLTEINGDEDGIFPPTNISRIQQANIRDAVLEKSSNFEVHWILNEDIIMGPHNYSILANNHGICLSSPSTSQRYGFAMVTNDVTLQHLLYYSNEEIRVWPGMPFRTQKTKHHRRDGNNSETRSIMRFLRQSPTRPRFVKSREVIDSEMIVWIESLPIYSTMIFKATQTV